ncbi:MAG: DNA repair protein, partial [Coriobacteriales bacterium]|nr:DNA repair protein [Coriobacteriales bacterium]
ITPAMKALGVRNRCRVFEIPKGIDYIMAKPQMHRYMEVSADIYAVYLRWISPQDIHVYSIDEVFIDATPYLRLYGLDARGLANMLMDAVFKETGVSATAGIGTNLFLAKVALDVTAKHAPDRIGYLDEAEFRRSIWHHRPITDIWNIGPGIAARLSGYGVFDLAGVCRMDEALLYKEFGVNAEYLIDHAWGIEPCTIQEIHDYVPETNSLSNGQVLPCDYSFDEARLVMKEMVDQLALDLVARQSVAGSISLTVGYTRGAAQWEGSRLKPSTWAARHGLEGFSHTGGSRKLAGRTASRRKLMTAFESLWDETTSTLHPIRRINLGLGGVVPEEFADVDLFTDVEAEDAERRLQEAVIAVKGKFGKNALLKAMSLTEKATARERNEQIGGHHA